MIYSGKQTFLSGCPLYAALSPSPEDRRKAPFTIRCLVAEKLVRKKLRMDV
jgi:hypothetical protein